MLVQPRTQASSRYPSYQRRLRTECDSANFPDKLDRWRHIRNRRGRLGTRLVLVVKTIKIRCWWCWRSENNGNVVLLSGTDLGWMLTNFLNERRRCKLLRGRVPGECSPGKLFWFNSLKSPSLGFWVIQTGYWQVPFSSGEALQLGKINTCFLYEKCLLWKIWPISVKRWKPVGIRAWLVVLAAWKQWNCDVSCFV